MKVEYKTTIKADPYCATAKNADGTDIVSGYLVHVTFYPGIVYVTAGLPSTGVRIGFSSGDKSLDRLPYLRPLANSPQEALDHARAEVLDMGVDDEECDYVVEPFGVAQSYVDMMAVRKQAQP